jgi:hypothetical protein
MDRETPDMRGRKEEVAASLISCPDLNGHEDIGFSLGRRIRQFEV